MTKHEKRMIANMASAAWEDFKEMEYAVIVGRFPFGYGWENAMSSDFYSDEERLALYRTEWATLHRVAGAFGIEYEITEKAREFDDKTRCWLNGENDGGDFA